MAQGAFVVSRSQANPHEIVFSVAPGSQGDVPEDQTALKNEIESTLTILRAIYTADDPALESYFQNLLSLAQAGLVGANAQPKLAQSALAALKNDLMVREAGKIKNGYLKRLGMFAIIFVASCFVLIGVFWQAQLLAELRGYMIAVTASMFGVWISYAMRRTEVTFEELPTLRSATLEPVVRLVFAGLITAVLCVMLSTRILALDVGNIQFINFKSNDELAIVLGVVAGLSEKALAIKISMRAAEVLSAKTGK